MHAPTTRPTPTAGRASLLLLLTGISLGSTPSPSAQELQWELQWARHFSGSSDVHGLGIAVDPTGHVLSAGQFAGTADFDPGPTTLTFTSAGIVDAFVCKLDPNGDLLWAVSFGGSGNDRAGAIATDSAGNAWVTGTFNGTVDFDPGPGVVELTSGVGADAFILQLDPSGALVWVGQVSGPSNNYGRAIALDGADNVYLTGRFGSTADFDPGPGVTTLTSAGNGDAFVLALTADGSFRWSRQVAGPGWIEGMGIAVDGAGNVLTTGSFEGTAEFDPGPSTVELTAAGRGDIFVWKLDSSGDLVWARLMGGPDDVVTSDYGTGIALDAMGNVAVTGWFWGTADFDPGPGVLTLTSAGANDVFVAKLDTDGDLLWAKGLGGTGSNYGRGIVTLGDESIATTGDFRDTVDLDPGPALAELTSAGARDAFLGGLNPDGEYRHAAQLAGPQALYGMALAGDASDGLCVSGYFSGTADFDPGPGVVELTSAGGADAYVVKVSLVAAANLLRNDEVSRLAPLTPPLATIFTGLTSMCSPDPTVSLDAADPSNCASSIEGEGSRLSVNGSDDRDDLYARGFAAASPAPDPDRGVLSDGLRPLVVYQMEGTPGQQLLAVKDRVEDTVRIVYRP